MDRFDLLTGKSTMQKETQLKHRLASKYIRASELDVENYLKYLGYKSHVKISVDKIKFIDKK